LTAGLALTMLPVTVWGLDASKIAEQINGLKNGLEASVEGNHVLVVGEATSSSTLNITIDADVTVKWKASYSRPSTALNTMLHLFGNGTFEVMEGAQIENAGAGYTIHSENVTIIVSGGNVKANTGTAIHIDNHSATVTVCGNGIVTTNSTNNAQTAIYMSNAERVVVKDNGKVAVMSTTGNGYAIQTYGDVMIMDNAEVYALGEGYGRAINALGVNSQVTVSGGKVWTKTGMVIHTAESNASVVVSGGTLYSYSSDDLKAVIHMDKGKNVLVTGTAKVQSLSDKGSTINTLGDVEISGNALVSAVLGRAIHTRGATSKVVLNSGLVFAYGPEILGGNNNAVIHMSSGTPTINESGIVVTWDEGSWDTNGQIPYESGDNKHLLVSPTTGATVVWAKNGEEHGIAYSNGTNVGFYPLPVTVIAINDDDGEGIDNGGGNGDDEGIGNGDGNGVGNGDGDGIDNGSGNGNGDGDGNGNGDSVNNGDSDSNGNCNSNGDSDSNGNGNSNENNGNNEEKNDSIVTTPSFAVTVIDGSGSGTYETGETVRITAKPELGRQQFVRWEITPSVTFINGSNSSSPTVQFIMPDYDVKITAIYEYIPSIKYGIAVLNNGNGTAVASESSASMGKVITLTAEAHEGYRFAKWIVNKGHIILSSETDNPAQFRMRDYGVEVKAIFEEITDDTEERSGDATGINEPPQAKALKAYTQNGVLYVSGATQGATIKVYTISGTLIYQSDQTLTGFTLPGRGVFIVTDGKDTIKVSN